MLFKTRNAVMYGAGNIGRGFIGMLLSQSGYNVTFIDVAKPLVDALNLRGRYPVRILDADRHEDVPVEDVDAIDGTDAQAVARAIAGADVMATAVGAGILKIIAPTIAEGIKQRFARGGKPLNIIICENLIDANKALEAMILEHLNEAEQAWFFENVGFVEASIGRMVPVQTPEMQDGDPLRVCVERYGYLPVDKDAFRGELPQIRNMVPFSPFDFYIRRKLYVHNMGHAVTAFLGLYTDKAYIADAIDDPEIGIIALQAMLESAEALSLKYGVPIADILRHIQDLLLRFGNQSLGDTCLRVGADIVRKLAPQDRLIGAARLCRVQGIVPAYICVGAAGAVYVYLKENGREQTQENAKEALAALSGLTEGNVHALILHLYELFAQGCTTDDLRRAAQREKANNSHEVV
ncbi:MAG: mannitol dehydrogenase [Eubacteriales bacterium]|nr:mannitol dehydrogenase [Eubacteriales bacterium]